MFKKLKIKLKNSVDPEKFKGDHISTYGFISYFNLKKSYMILPKEIFRLNPDRIVWSEVQPKANLPHRDHVLKTSLNIYIEPRNAVVRFYKVKQGGEPYSPDPKIFYPNLFYHKDLDLCDQFIAEPYDSYLLDVSNVHEVTGVENLNRTMIQLSWYSRSFDQVLNQIGEEYVY